MRCSPCIRVRYTVVVTLLARRVAKRAAKPVNRKTTAYVICPMGTTASTNRVSAPGRDAARYTAAALVRSHVPVEFVAAPAVETRPEKQARPSVVCPQRRNVRCLGADH